MSAKEGEMPFPTSNAAEILSTHIQHKIGIHVPAVSLCILLQDHNFDRISTLAHAIHAGGKYARQGGQD